MRYLTFFVLSCLFMACKTTSVVDYEKGLNWDPQKTYQYYDEMNSGLSPIDQERVVKNIDSLLQLKGFQKVEKCHYKVSYFVEEVISEPATLIDENGLEYVVENPLSPAKILQRLTIEIRDATLNEKLLWQGIHEGNYSQKTSEKRKDLYYSKAIAEMLAAFPPQE